MTNEEKAREYQAFIESNNHSAEAYGFYNAYLSACEWKDHQFKEYLEKKKDSLELDYHKDSFEGNVHKHYMLTEIINELFGGK